MADRELTVYRTYRPELIKHWYDGQANLKAWSQRMDAFLDEQGLGNGTVWTYNITGHFGGVDHDGAEVPNGWRVDRRTGRLMPRLSTREGKAIGAKLDELRKPDPRADLPGMPGDCFVSLALLTCGLHLMRGALYATWGLPIPEAQVDLTVWQPVKLSEYYAVLELEEDDG